MSIWKHPITIEEINHLIKDTMVSYLGIEFTEIGEDFLSARMPVDARTRQPYGIMHGGASCVLAETIASIGAVFCVDPSKEQCVGIEINTSHVRSVKSGWVLGTAKPLHLGKTTQLWEIRIENEKNQLVSVNRLRLAVLEKSRSNITA